MTKVRKQIVLFIFAFTLVFGVVAVLNTDYTFAASKPAKVKGLKVVKSSTNTVKLTYKKAKRAKKYKIYRKIGTGSWKLVKTTKKRSASFTQNQLNRYYWKVRAIRGKKKGKYSSTVSLQLPMSKYSSYNAINYGTLFVISSCWYDSANGFYRYKDGNSTSHISTYCSNMQKQGWYHISDDANHTGFYDPFKVVSGDAVKWMCNSSSDATATEFVAICTFGVNHPQSNYPGNVEIDCYTKEELIDHGFIE